MVGYVTEDGTPVTNEISTGASALFPIGAQLLEAPIPESNHPHSQDLSYKATREGSLGKSPLS